MTNFQIVEWKTLHGPTFGCGGNGGGGGMIELCHAKRKQSHREKLMRAARERAEFWRSRNGVICAFWAGYAHSLQSRSDKLHGERR